MTGIRVVQGRELSAGDIGQMQGLLAEHPDWGRTRLSEEICHRWDWRNAPGRPKDMAARTLLLKLERSGHIRLPGPEGAPAAELDRFHARYLQIVDTGYSQNPAPEPPNGPKRRGRRKQSKARNLLDRFRDLPDGILAFMRDFAAPFDNNRSGIRE